MELQMKVEGRAFLIFTVDVIYRLKPAIRFDWLIALKRQRHGYTRSR